MARFAIARVIFAGDAAHRSAHSWERGCHSGVQDADNPGAGNWPAVLKGEARDICLDSYDAERSMPPIRELAPRPRDRFITPKTPQSRVFRDAVLHMAYHAPFRRPMVNSGRLSVLAPYDGSAL